MRNLAAIALLAFLGAACTPAPTVIVNNNPGGGSGSGDGGSGSTGGARPTRVIEAPANWGGTVTVNNMTGWDIYQVYLSYSDSDDWGSDQLGTDILMNGEFVTLSGLECAYYDLRVIDEVGSECSLMGIALCDEDATWNLTADEMAACGGFGAEPVMLSAMGNSSDDPDWWSSSLTIINDSQWDIYNIYLSASSDPEWGPDQLGSDILSKGGDTLTLTGIACDSWDLKFVDEDGDVCTLMAQDLCLQDGVWHITDDELLTCQGWM